ncbi:primosome assembly protein PriA [Haloglycomyces albus]|uniref:primosomal protein N' family DNA-binding protein n=1 Tax=Haloglycomyces albus TaxID=526067 RepID=UPI00146F9A7E|nr:primosome assembly protein PriA [Haloglycomyces albus]
MSDSPTTALPGLESPRRQGRFATVAVDQPLPHLDQVFDYSIPDSMAERVWPGSVVRVPFGRQRLTGFVLERKGESAYRGPIRDIARVISLEPVLTPEIASLARKVADRYAGTLADVIRLAVPDRRKSVEREVSPTAPDVGAPSQHGFSRYIAGEAFIRALREGIRPRVVWDALPGEDWALRLAEVAGIVAAQGKGVVLLVPDQRDLDRLDLALRHLVGEDSYVTLSAFKGPTARYRAYLAAKRGAVPIVAGTRAAVFAPVADIGLLAIWDDGDESYVERHAPYCHSREVLLTRAAMSDSAVIIGGCARTAQAQLLAENGWAHDVVPQREYLRDALPHIAPTGDTQELERDAANARSRIPPVAWQAMRSALNDGQPVLVQVPRLGYVPGVACADCYERAWCSQCSGPLRLPGRSREFLCGWCGHREGFTCAHCGGRRIRATVRGVARTAEELRFAFGDTPVLISTGDDPVTSAVTNGIVVSTPGVEPAALDGYGAVVLVDTWSQLTRAELDASEEALRQWMNAATLARSSATVVAVADGAVPAVQALIRWNARWFASRELQERRELGFPPVMRMAALEGISGEPDRVADSVEDAVDFAVERLGPLPVDEDNERLLLRVRRRHAPDLARALAQVNARRAEAKSAVVRTVMEPRHIA